jgi:DNA-directed RNA polymerase subunit M
MYPEDDFFVCKKCGFKIKKSGTNIVISKQKEKEIQILVDKIDDVLPKIRILCPKCGNLEASWILRQMRGSDEPETRFFTCLKCGYKWREQ